MLFAKKNILDNDNDDERLAAEEKDEGCVSPCVKARVGMKRLTGRASVKQSGREEKEPPQKMQKKINESEFWRPRGL